MYRPVLAVYITLRLFVSPTNKEIELILDGNSADPLLEQFKSAQDAEGVAIAALHDAMKGGTKDKEILMTLTDRMTEAHNK